MMRASPADFYFPGTAPLYEPRPLLVVQDLVAGDGQSLYTCPTGRRSLVYDAKWLPPGSPAMSSATTFYLRSNSVNYWLGAQTIDIGADANGTPLWGTGTATAAPLILDPGESLVVDVPDTFTTSTYVRFAVRCIEFSVWSPVRSIKMFNPRISADVNDAALNFYTVPAGVVTCPYRRAFNSLYTAVVHIGSVTNQQATARTLRFAHILAAARRPPRAAALLNLDSIDPSAWSVTVSATGGTVTVYPATAGSIVNTHFEGPYEGEDVLRVYVPGSFSGVLWLNIAEYPLP